MPAILQNIINPQGFEIVRDRIGQLLASEIAQQISLNPSEDSIKISGVFIERNIPFDAEELPAIAVSFSEGNYSNQSPGQADGEYIFNIDCFSNSPAKSTGDGDVLATRKNHRLLGVCRAIMTAPGYMTLGFAPPFIQRVLVTNMLIAETDKNDALGTAMGRLQVTVKLTELSEMAQPRLLPGADTTIKLETTDMGYVYIIDLP